MIELLIAFLVSTILFTGLIITETWVEAAFYDARYRVNMLSSKHKDSDWTMPKFKIDDHVIYTVFRIIAAVACGLLYYKFSGPLWKSAVYTVSLMGYFIFIQGFYYYFRNMRNPSLYPHKFWDEPTGHDTAKIDIGLRVRILTFVLFLLANAGMILFFN